MVISWRSSASTSYSDDDASRCLRDFWSERPNQNCVREKGQFMTRHSQVRGNSARTTSCSMLFIEDSAGTRRMALSSNRAAQRFRHLATSPEAMTIFSFSLLLTITNVLETAPEKKINAGIHGWEGGNSRKNPSTQTTTEKSDRCRDDVGEFTSTLYRG